MSKHGQKNLKVGVSSKRYTHFVFRNHVATTFELLFLVPHVDYRDLFFCDDFKNKENYIFTYADKIDAIISLH